MAVVKDVYAPKPTNVANVAKKEAISEVKQTAEDIDVITNTKKKAEDLVGFSGVAAERDAAVAEAAKQRDAREAEHQATLKGTIEDLGKKITETSAGDKAQIKELQAEVKATSAELIKSMMDSLTDKINTLEKMKTDQAGSTDIAKEVKGIKALFNELGLANQQQVSNAMPPEMTLQMKKMDFDMQQSVEDRADERVRRDKEWQLTVRKWDEEKESRHNEFNAKIQVEREKMGMLSGLGQQIGEVIAKSTVTKPGTTSVSKGERHIRTEATPSREAEATEESNAIDITVPVGQAVQFDCQNCNEPVVVAEDAENTICANCETVYRVTRSPVAT